MARFTLAAWTLAILAVPAAALAKPADGDAYLKRFEGRWYGSGLLRRSPQSPQEAVRCNLTGEDTTGQLAMEGQCAGADFSVHVRGRLHYDPAARRYIGFWQGGTAAQPIGLAGARRGRALVLTAGAAGAQTGRMVLRPEGRSGFRLVLHEAQAGPAPLVDIGFRPLGREASSGTP